MRQKKFGQTLFLMAGIVLLVYLWNMRQGFNINGTDSNVDIKANSLTSAAATAKTDSRIEELVKAAKRVSERNGNGTVFITLINDAYLIFAYSWLCNTKEMGVHDSVLIATSSQASKDKLAKDWPKLEVVVVDIGGMKGNQTYTHVGYVKIGGKRAELLQNIIDAGIAFFLIEMDCVWFANPAPEMLKHREDADILVTPVDGVKGQFASGFVYLFPTDKGKALWHKHVERLKELAARLGSRGDNERIPETLNDQNYMSTLLGNRYGGVKFALLSLDLFPDGKWYKRPEKVRKATRPLIINNNWIIGNKAKIDRAKQWKHWFIHDDWTCDMALVRQTVYH